MLWHFVFIVRSPLWTAEWACESRLFPFRRSISVTDSQDNFAVGVTRLTELVRAVRFAERKDAIDYRCEVARVDDLRDLSELTTARVASHTECSPYVVPAG